MVTSSKDRDRLGELAAERNGQNHLENGGDSGRQSDFDRLVILPNGVDLAYFKPMDLPRNPMTIIFSGKMSYHANGVFGGCKGIPRRP